MHTCLVCAYNSQDFAQTQENVARSHDRETVTFRNSEHNARHLLYSKKNTSRGVHLKSCQKQLKVNARASGDCDSVMFVS